ncbi:MAG: serine/threonine protein kinase [Alphaproteobacteria bacterium]
MVKVLRNALKAGTMLDVYRVEEVLGHGGFGITYLAEDIDLEKKVAIKEYLPVGLAIRDSSFSVHPQSSEAEKDYRWGLQQFLREAKTLAKFHHANIVQVLRFFKANGTAYIVMNFVEGESLHERMRKRKKIDEKELLSLIFPLLDGLEKVHETGFLHRDIKPGNIFVAKDGTPMLLDFGAARAALKDKGRSLTAIVTRGYAPIEQYSSRGNQGPWTDIYALAGVLYEIVTGKDPEEATDRVMEDPQVPALIAGKNRLSDTVLAAIDHALAVKPEDRPQSISEWRKEFAIEGKAAAFAPAAKKAASAGNIETTPSGVEASASPASRQPASRQPASRQPEGPAKRRGPAVKKDGGLPESAPARTIVAENLGDYPLTTARWRLRPRGIAAAIAGVGLLAIAGLALVLIPDTREPAPVEPVAIFDFRNEEIRLVEMMRKSAEVRLTRARPKQIKKPVLAASSKLKGLISGSQVSFTRTEGIGRHEARWTFRASGRLDGAAFVSESAYEESTLSIRDSGKWWVKKEALCIRWRQWDKARTRCYGISSVRGNIYQAKGGGIFAGRFILER